MSLLGRPSLLFPSSTFLPLLPSLLPFIHPFLSFFLSFSPSLHSFFFLFAFLLSYFFWFSYLLTFFGLLSGLFSVFMKNNARSWEVPQTWVADFPATSCTCCPLYLNHPLPFYPWKTTTCPSQPRLILWIFSKSPRVDHSLHRGITVPSLFLNCSAMLTFFLSLLFILSDLKLLFGSYLQWLCLMSGPWLTLIEWMRDCQGPFLKSAKIGISS